MADIWYDVDIALSEVPVNILPLIDDTDFKSIEAAVAWNAPGMALEWNFITTLGAFTLTAVVPTNAGVHDWVIQGNGMYTIEIPNVGGTVNNDTEGFGWFTGVATGILPWRGPIIGFRAAATNNSMIDGTTIDVNVTAISGDTGSADNLELATDGGAYNVGGGAIVAASVTGATGSVTGSVGSVAGNVAGNVVGSVGSVAGNVVGSVGSVAGNVAGNVVGSVGSVAGNVVGSVGSVAGNVVGSVGSVAGNVAGNVVGSVGSVAGNVAGNVVGSVGSVAGNVVGSVGSVAGNVVGSVGSVAGNVVGSVGSVVGLTNVTIADQTWDEAIGGHLNPGSTGEKLNAAGAAGDPWLTALPGAYAVGTAGNIIGNFLTTLPTIIWTWGSRTLTSLATYLIGSVRDFWAVNFSLSACQGETVVANVVIMLAGGAPMDITGFSVVWVMSQTRGSAPLLTKSTALGTLTITNPLVGAITFTITSAETDALAAETYAMEIHIKAPAPGSREYCAMHGRIEITASSIGAI